MTGTHCGACGAQTTPGASFCATCGAALAAPPAAASPAGRSTATAGGPWTPANPAPDSEIEERPVVRTQLPPVPVAGQPPVPQQPQPPVGQAPAQPQYWAPQTAQQPPLAGEPQSHYPPYAGQQPYGGQVPYPGQSPFASPYGAPGEHSMPRDSWASGQPHAGQPYGDQPYQPGPAVPWGTAAPGGVHHGGPPRRNPADALLNGDWGGAVRAAGIAVAAMLVVSLVGVLLLTEGGIGFRETMALVFGVVCLAVGGDAYAEADVESFGGSFSLGVLPLTVTLVGLLLLGRLYAARLRARPPASATDALLQGVRTALVFTAPFLPLALLTRYSAEQNVVVALAGRLGVGVVSTLLGALLFAVATLGLTWLFSRSTTLTGRAGAARAKARAPLVGAVAVFAAGVLAVLAALLHGLIEEGEKLAQLGAAVLASGNGALLSVLLSAGVPLEVEGSASAGFLGRFSPTGVESVDLFTLTDESAWYWLLPVLLLASMLLVATALAVRQNTIEDARKEGFRFAGALALAAFAATLLLRISAETETSGFEAAADASIMFNPVLAALVLAIWGGLTGLLAPVVAAQMPTGFVTGVRRRFGAAEEPAPPVQGYPAPPQAY